jgi:hypothetical protein
MHSSDPTFHVMHTLRLRGVCPKDVLVAVTGRQADEVEPVLWPLEDDGLAKLRSGGRMDGWALTTDGRARHAELLDADRTAGDLPTVLAGPYARFLEVNRPFIDLCSDWQIRSDDGETNDHTDAAYDATILERLETIHEVGGPAAEEAGAAVERFAGYAPRLAHAIGRVRDGDHEWLTTPQIDSYHTVWFELHDDLLQSQGIERSEHT